MFQVLKVLIIRICKIKPLYLLFLDAFISFYISRYHFSQIFRTSFNINSKKDFRHKFSFLTDSLNRPLSLPTPLKVTKVFCWCSLANSTLKVKQLLWRTNIGQRVISYYIDPSAWHGMMLFQLFLYNLMWYTFLVLKVLQSNFYLNIYFFSTLNLSFDVKWEKNWHKKWKT